MKEIKCRIEGQVQDVCMRDYVSHLAQKLGVAGTVENMADGSVEVFAQGHTNTLLEFVRGLEVGSEHADVKKVIVEHREIHDTLYRFSIL